MGSSAPTPPDFNAAAKAQADASSAAVQGQTAANRPNQTTPFATTSWTQGPNGQWQQNVSLNGPLGGLQQGLQGQAAQAMAQPFSLSGLPEVQSGDGARQQAFNAAYGQAESRLNPMWQQREDATRTRLLQQGLDPGSEAFQREMGSLGQQRNDAYTSALNSAQGQATAAGDSVFRNSLMGRQQALSDALRQRGQAFGELQGLQGLMGMPSFMGAGLAQVPQLLQAAGLQSQADLQRYQIEQQAQSDMISGGAGLLGTGLGLALSDERAKQDVVRLSKEAIPGVPMATWRYRDGYGDPSVRYLGVVAQDLARVRPEAVSHGPGGLLYVSPRFAPRPLDD